MLVIAGGSAAIGAARRLAVRRRVQRELRMRPTLDPTTSDGAEVRVTGVVRALPEAPLLLAPLSGRRCVIYTSVIDATSWMVRGVAERGRHERFAITGFLLERGAEGPVRVEGSYALLDVPSLPDKALERSRQEQVLLAHGVPLRRLPSVKFEETVIEEGMTISVAGLVMMDPADEATLEERSFRDAPAFTLRLTGNRAHPLAIGAHA